MLHSKKRKVVIPKRDIAALVPADCHIGKGTWKKGRNKEKAEHGKIAKVWTQS